MTRVAGLLLAVLLLAGCGQGDTAAMDQKFERLDFQISTLETVNAQYNQQHFARLTQKYIALVHRYEDQLGKDEAKQRLIDMGDELDSYCLPCTGVLYIEARKL
jgi:ABC-type glycerol-3-phosphate transport system substrate-binding protein